MKKIILSSFFILSSAMMTSRIAHSIAGAAPIQNISADDIGGQQGIPPPPTPKPTTGG